jgi:ABC-2 type transport system ATP-binding protein
MLKVQNIRKEYATVVAVDDISFDAVDGEILGLIGPNGAGKTTTIRMILNIIRPDKGEITFDGQKFNESIRNSFGYLPEERGLYRKNKLLNTIVYFAGLKGISAAEGKRRAYEWLKRFDLLNYYDRKIEELSKGNQQKVQFIISILHDPKLVVLDEPFSGLDPINQLLLKDILTELKEKGKAIIFSTHQMEQAEKLCDRLCLINRGKMVLHGTLSDIKQQFGRNSVHVEYAGDGSFIKDLPFVRQAAIYNNYAELVLQGSVTSQRILSDIMPHLDVRKFEFVEPSLNSIFIEVVGGEQTAEKNEAVKNIEKPVITAAPKNPKLIRYTVITALTTILAVAVIIAAALNVKISFSTVVIIVIVEIMTVYRLMRLRNKLKADQSKQGGK